MAEYKWFTIANYFSLLRMFECQTQILTWMTLSHSEMMLDSPIDSHFSVLEMEGLAREGNESCSYRPLATYM